MEATIPGNPPPAPNSNTFLLAYIPSFRSRYDANAIAAFHLKRDPLGEMKNTLILLTGAVPTVDGSRPTVNLI